MAAPLPQSFRRTHKPIHYTRGSFANIVNDANGQDYEICHMGTSPEWTVYRKGGWRNNGTATIVSGTTNIAVNHGLSVTPSDGDCVVTPTNTIENATKFYVDSYTSTQFTIAVDLDPEATTATFAWACSVY